MGPGLRNRGIMKSTIGYTVITLFLLLPSIVSADGEKILVFRDAKPYNGHIPAINAGIAMVREFAAANNFSVDTTVNLSSFNSANLAKYEAVVLMQPYREVNGQWLNDTMNAAEDSAFQSFLLSGKGLVGIHCADRLNNNSQWYLNLLGAQYLNDIGPQNCTYHVANPNHPMTKDISQTFTNSQQVRCNKLFFSDTSKGFTVLIKADQKDYPSDQKQSFYPFVWMHDYQGARVWCGSMGHTPETFSSDQIWRQLMLRGILYALNRPDYVRCADPISRPMFRNTAEWTVTKGRERDHIVRIFDLTGRMAGATQSICPRTIKPAFGPYIVVPNNNSTNRSPAVLWIPQIR
jgi:uncharacterized protein